MELRIIENNHKFYVQKKFIFWWVTLTDFDFDSDSLYDMDFSSIEEAKNFIDEMNSENVSKVVWMQGSNK